MYIYTHISINIINSTITITIITTIVVVSIVYLFGAASDHWHYRKRVTRNSVPFRKHLYLNMAAPQTFARTFTKPGSCLY